MDAIRGRNDRQSASSLVERCLVSYHRLAPCCLILQLMSTPLARLHLPHACGRAIILFARKGRL